MIKSFIKTILIIIGSLLAIFGLYLLFMTLTDYNPEDVIKLTIENNNVEILKKDTTLSVITYNIGYCGLDDGQDFFMDGGKGSRSESKDKTLKNLTEITNFLKIEDASFLFLQEVDIDATRSYHINQYNHLQDNLKDYNSSFAINYKVPWVPVPITKPHGSVEGGLVSFSKYKLESSTRYQLPGKEKWPRQLALLDRCFIESRISVEDGKELVLVNAHLSAYDKGGIIRAQQLNFLKDYISKEYEKGNYIIVGGDWNHLIPGTDPSIFKTNMPWPEWLKKIPESFILEGFSWVADSLVPTNRTNESSYVDGQNYLSVIDGFLVSPNVEIQSVEGYSLDFKYADHNPVIMKFNLK